MKQLKRNSGCQHNNILTKPKSWCNLSTLDHVFSPLSACIILIPAETSKDVQRPRECTLMSMFPPVGVTMMTGSQNKKTWFSEQHASEPRLYTDISHFNRMLYSCSSQIISSRVCLAVCVRVSCHCKPWFPWETTNAHNPHLSDKALINITLFTRSQWQISCNYQCH